MNYNGYNKYCKKRLGNVKIGWHICPICGEHLEEFRSFREQPKTDFFNVINSIYQCLRTQNVSYDDASTVIELIFPRGKDTIQNDFTNSVERTYIPPVEYIKIVNYDEQHPKMDGTQKFRLTLLDGVTGRPIADELYDNKSFDTIKTFIGAHLDPTRKTFVVTDLYSSYPGSIWKFLWGEPDSPVMPPAPEQADSGLFSETRNHRAGIGEIPLNPSKDSTRYRIYTIPRHDSPVPG